MTKLSLIDKIGVLFKMISSSKIYILIFLVLLLMGYALTTTSRNKKNIIQKVFLVIYIIVLGIIIYTYRNNLGNMFDYMMNNLFIVIYFPNLAIYLAAIITTNIVMWTSVFNNKIPRFMKNINVTVYCIMTYLLILILNIINENKLDVFIQSSVYSNSNAQALIELSSTIFVIWIVFLIIYKLVKPLFLKQQVQQSQVVKQQVQVVEQKIITPQVPVRPRIEYQQPKKPDKPYRQIEAPSMVIGNKIAKAEKLYHQIDAPSMVIGNSNKRFIEKSYHGTQAPRMVIGNNNKKVIEKEYRQIQPPYIVKADKNTISVEKTVQDTKSYDDLLTLDDYKLLLSILKEQKDKEKQEQERQAKVDKEQAKFRELQELYLNTNPTSF